MKSLALLIFLLFPCSNIFCQAQQVISDEQAIKSLRQFYVNYIKYKYESTKKSRKKLDSLLHRYSTPRLTEQLKEQYEQNYDFIVGTNGADIIWLNTLKVAKDRTANDIYEVSWVIPNDPGENKKNEITRIRLQLIKTSTGILIDRIIM